MKLSFECVIWIWEWIIMLWIQTRIELEVWQPICINEYEFKE
jgi:hypothetical protein